MGWIKREVLKWSLQDNAFPYGYTLKLTAESLNYNKKIERRETDGANFKHFPKKKKQNKNKNKKQNNKMHRGIFPSRVYC